MIHLDDIQKIEELFKLPSGFIKNLDNENDWSYVIKTHALFEALFTQLLVEELNKPALRSNIYKLPMNGRTSKMSFLLSLNSFEEVHQKTFKKFIQNLSELRNLIVHHAENLNFKFQQYYLGLSLKEKREFKNGICYLSTTYLKECEVKDEIFEPQIRKLVSINVLMVLEILSLYVQNSTLKNNIDKLES